MLLVFRQHRLALSATGGASATLPASSDSLLHCGEAIEGLFLGVYKVVCFTFSGLATIYNFQCQPQTAETGYVFCPCKPDVIFEDAALRYSNKQHKIPIFLISITPQVSLRYNKSIYRRKR